MATIKLHCVSEKGKLRIKFDSFTDENGKSYTNVYNNAYNCQFPREIRKEGTYYEIPADDLILSTMKTAPFYRIKKDHIKIIEEKKPEKIYDVVDCIICLSNPTSQILSPCGHLCLCDTCYMDHGKQLKLCPLCRKKINK